MAFVKDCVQDDDSNTAVALQEAIFLGHILPHVSQAFLSVRWNPVQHTESAIDLVETLFRVAHQLTAPSDLRIENDDSNSFVLPTETNDDTASSRVVKIVEDDIVHGIVYQKLTLALSQWKPEVLTHSKQVITIKDRLDLWLLPWFPLLDRRHSDQPSMLIPIVLSDVKRQLRSSLTFLQRQVSSSLNDDCAFVKSCLLVLVPWTNLLKIEPLQAMTTQLITPRLSRALSRLTIHRSTQEQDWTLIDALLQMKEMRLISDLDLCSLIEGELLVHWASTVHHWLSSAAANQTEEILAVAENYVEWKMRIFSAETNAHPDTKSNGILNSSLQKLVGQDDRICRIFYSVLCMIQAASTTLDGRHPNTMQQWTLHDLKPVRGQLNFSVVQARRMREQRAVAKEELERMNALSSGSVLGDDVLPLRFQRGRMDVTFREVVEAFAKQHDVLLQPRLQGDKVSTKDGKPIFLFGSVPIYLDSNVVFAQTKTGSVGEWRPMSLEQLASMAAISVNATR
jgi:hypothetical protein